MGLLNPTTSLGCDFANKDLLFAQYKATESPATTKTSARTMPAMAPPSNPLPNNEIIHS